uniref:Uncharacterized protein n=1 Tax=Romanomermis culicivorax TaxID=13658 RepID=A0A915K6B1_ROMCU
MVFKGRFVPKRIILGINR